MNLDGGINYLFTSLVMFFINLIISLWTSKFEDKKLFTKKLTKFSKYGIIYTIIIFLFYYLQNWRTGFNYSLSDSRFLLWNVFLIFVLYLFLNDSIETFINSIVKRNSNNVKSLKFKSMLVINFVFFVISIIVLIKVPTYNRLLEDTKAKITNGNEQYIFLVPKDTLFSISNSEVSFGDEVHELNNFFKTENSNSQYMVKKGESIELFNGTNIYYQDVQIDNSKEKSDIVLNYEESANQKSVHLTKKSILTLKNDEKVELLEDSNILIKQYRTISHIAIQIFLISLGSMINYCYKDYRC